MTIGQAIRKARKKKGIKQYKLAESVGVKSSMVSWWETGRSFPHILNCISLADALGVTLDELVGRRTENEQKEPIFENQKDIKQEWISVKERLPPYGVTVLIYRNGTITTDWICSAGRWFNCMNRKATHWMPFPEAPKKY